MTSQLTSAIRSHNNNILSIFSARKKVGSNAADERRPALCQGSVCLEILNFSWAALGLPICPIAVNPIECGGGRNPPPLSYKCGSPKNAQRKSCQFFVTFPKYVNGVLETTFCSQITFGLTGRWQKWSKLAYFRKGGPCREQYDAKIINTYKCQLQHVARNFLVLFML